MQAELQIGKISPQNTPLTSAHLKTLQISNQQNKTATKVLLKPGTYNKDGIFEEKMCEK